MTTNQHRWLPSLRELSHEQLNIINDSLEGGSLVYGSAGTGKTVVAIYRAMTLLGQGKSVKILVYTNVLKGFIRDALKEEDSEETYHEWVRLESCVETLYRWVYHTHDQLLGKPPQDGKDKYSDWVDALIGYFKGHPRAIPHFQYILVDEGQDFKSNVAELMHMLSDNVFVGGDTAQSLYVYLRSLDELTTSWGGLSRRSVLVKNYRNPLTVAKVAAKFLDSSYQDEAEFLDNVQGRRAEMKPVWYQVGSSDEQST